MAKKLLYIIANSKPENLSTSRTVAREFINAYLQKNPEDTVEELDLYHNNIPLLNYRLFDHRATIVEGAEYDKLSNEEKGMVDQIHNLANQFLAADRYVISAPMWSIFFPSILKQYLDCIIINGKTISIGNNEVKGLLDNKERHMVYIQSSGGSYPAIMSRKLNHGLKYLEDVFSFLGIAKFKNIMIEGVDEEGIGKDKAIEEALLDVKHIVRRF